MQLDILGNPGCSTNPINVSPKRKRRPKGEGKEICSKCEKKLEPTRVGKQRYCKACHAENMRNNRPKHSELSEVRKKKANARSYANVYLKRGLIKKQPCEVCKSESTQMHHDDYNKPLIIRWLCAAHHLELHKSQPDGNI